MKKLKNSAGENNADVPCAHIHKCNSGRCTGVYNAQDTLPCYTQASNLQDAQPATVNNVQSRTKEYLT